MSSSEYVGARVALGFTGRTMPTSRSALRAWSRCQPVSTTSWSRIADFSARVPRRYSSAIFFVTALRTTIESSIAGA